MVLSLNRLRKRARGAVSNLASKLSNRLNKRFASLNRPDGPSSQASVVLEKKRRAASSSSSASAKKQRGIATDSSVKRKDVKKKKATLLGAQPAGPSPEALAAAEAIAKLLGVAVDKLFEGLQVQSSFRAFWVLLPLNPTKVLNLINSSLPEGEQGALSLQPVVMTDWPHGYHPVVVQMGLETGTVPTNGFMAGLETMTNNFCEFVIQVPHVHHAQYPGQHLTYKVEIFADDLMSMMGPSLAFGYNIRKAIMAFPDLDPDHAFPDRLNPYIINKVADTIPANGDYSKDMILNALFQTKGEFKSLAEAGELGKSFNKFLAPFMQQDIISLHSDGLWKLSRFDYQFYNAMQIREAWTAPAYKDNTGDESEAPSRRRSKRAKASEDGQDGPYPDGSVIQLGTDDAWNGLLINEAWDEDSRKLVPLTDSPAFGAVEIATTWTLQRLD